MKNHDFSLKNHENKFSVAGLAKFRVAATRKTFISWGVRDKSFSRGTTRKTFIALPFHGGCRKIIVSKIRLARNRVAATSVAVYRVLSSKIYPRFRIQSNAQKKTAADMLKKAGVRSKTNSNY